MVAQKTRVLFVLSLFLLGVAFEVNAQTINSVEPNFDLQQYSGGWSAGGNATYMTRLNPADVPIFVGGGGTTLSANELDFDFSPGYEAFIATSLKAVAKSNSSFPVWRTSVLLHRRSQAVQEIRLQRVLQLPFLRPPFFQRSRLNLK